MVEVFRLLHNTTYINHANIYNITVLHHNTIACLSVSINTYTHRHFTHTRHHHKYNKWRKHKTNLSLFVNITFMFAYMIQEFSKNIFSTHNIRCMSLLYRYMIHHTSIHESHQSILCSINISWIVHDVDVCVLCSIMSVIHLATSIYRYYRWHKTSDIES